MALIKRHARPATPCATPTSSSRRCSRRWTSRRQVFRELDRRVQAGRHPGDQHLDARRRRDRRGDRAARGRHRHCTSSARRTSCACWRSCAAKTSAKDVIATTMKLGQDARQGRRCWSACATASSATACWPRYFTAGRVPARGRRAAAAGRQGARSTSASPMGPFTMSDLAGLDIGWRIRKRQAATCRRRARLERSPTSSASAAASARRPAPAATATRRATARPLPDPEVEEIIERRISPSSASSAAPIGDEEIVEALPLRADQRGRQDPRRGHRLARAGDIDIIYLYGYGFPACARRPDVLRRPRRPQERLRRLCLFRTARRGGLGHPRRS